MKKTILATLVFFGSIGVSMATVHHPAGKKLTIASKIKTRESTKKSQKAK